MSSAFGRPINEVRERVGDLHQVLRVDQFVEDDGPARGTRRLRLVNGGGIEIDVHPDRAMDLGQVTVGGIPVAWISPVGVTSPHFFEPEGTRWLRTYTGGLMALCGLDAYGPPSEDDGVAYGLHGRIGATPAHVTGVEATAEGVAVSGIVRQVGVFGEHLVLRRRISSAAGSDTFVLEDSVTNEGFASTPHMVLYHVNLGWPLIDEHTVVDIPSQAMRARDAEAERGMDDALQLMPPTPGFQEQVFHHGFAAGTDPTVRVSNPEVGIELAMSFSRDTLPYLVQWKMMGQGHYALGIEPTNVDSLAGRAGARAQGLVPVLEPGERVDYRLVFRLRRTAV